MFTINNQKPKWQCSLHHHCCMFATSLKYNVECVCVYQMKKKAHYRSSDLASNMIFRQLNHAVICSTIAPKMSYILIATSSWRFLLHWIKQNFWKLALFISLILKSSNTALRNLYRKKSNKVNMKKENTSHAGLIHISYNFFLNLRITSCKS